MWRIIILVLLVLTLLAVVFLLTRFHRFSPVLKLAEKNRAFSWLVALLPLLVLALFCCVSVSAYIVVVLHLLAGFLLCALIALAVRVFTGYEIAYDIQGTAAVVLTALWLGVGWYAAHHVSETDYRVETDKALRRGYRIVEIADAHLGVTLDGEKFARELEKVQALQPDAVVLVGDFVDDDSKAADMIAACKALGDLKTAFGVYYVYGNHDEGYYTFRDFHSGRLREELTKNGVVILEDEAVLLDDSLYIIGRRDRSDRVRASMETLMQTLDREKYTVVLDHQPNDYDAEASAGADLVLSGHTHGGHIFPAGQIGMLMGANDALYGMETRGDTTFIVSSGISGWAIPFKTLCRSEIAVVDIAARRTGGAA